jgi:hypothetical protein
MHRELGGGKFGNGAVTAAMAYAFNDALHPDPSTESLTMHWEQVEGKWYQAYYYDCGSSECLLSGANFPANHPLNADYVEALNASAAHFAQDALTILGGAGLRLAGLVVDAWSALTVYQTHSLSPFVGMGAGKLWGAGAARTIGPRAGEAAGAAGDLATSHAIANVQDEQH